MVYEKKSMLKAMIIFKILSIIIILKNYQYFILIIFILNMVY